MTAEPGAPPVTKPPATGAAGETGAPVSDPAIAALRTCQEGL